MTVIANIIGGLGNQMFQYAASYALAKKNGLELKLDLDDYNTFRDRNFELPYAFDLKFSIASKKDVKNNPWKGYPYNSGEIPWDAHPDEKILKHYFRQYNPHL